MKKSLIVLGILAGITGVAHAENKTVLYGSLGYSVGIEGTVDRTDSIGGNVGGAVDSVTDNNWDLRTTSSQFGIKGNEDINGDLSAIYNFEFGVGNKDGVNKTKKAYLGLKGGFGEVTFGKQSAAYGKAVGFNDNFNELGDSYDSRKISKSNFNKGIKYKTPGTLYGFELTSTVELDGADPATKGVDLWEVAAIYDANGAFAGVGYQNRLREEDGSEGSQEVMGTSLGYKNDAFKAGLGYVHEASVGNFYNIGAESYAGPNTFRAGLGYADEKGKAKDAWTGNLGYQYNFSERTYSWVEGQYKFNKESKVDGYNVVVGIRHDF